MKAPDRLVRRVVSVIIAKYPDSPSSSHRRAMESFCQLAKKLYGLRPKPDTRSRDSLTRWGQSSFSLWKEADFAASSPPLWGPIFWSFMLRTARLYTRKRRRKFSAWLDSLMYLLPCKKCAKHYRLMLKSSIKKWQRAKKADDLVAYIAWMQRTVKRRVQKEEKLLSPLTLKRPEPWGVKDANNSFEHGVVRRKPDPPRKKLGTVKKLAREPVRAQGKAQGKAQRKVPENRRATRNTQNIATRNIATQNTATSTRSTRNTRSTRSPNASRLDEWYGAISGVGANFFG